VFLQFLGEEPERPFSGKFNIRLKPSLHRDAFIEAKRTGKSLNQWVTEAILHNINC
jgi:predicted HicB family RNase H-like nuclease